MSLLSKNVLRLKAELTTKTERHLGFIESLSKKDIHFLTSQEVPEIDSYPGSPIEVEFACHDGNMLNLNCKLKWAYKTPPFGLTNIVAEVIDSKPNYETFLKSL